MVEGVPVSSFEQAAESLFSLAVGAATEENFFGTARSIFVDEDVGWPALAQDRERRRSARDAFAKATEKDAKSGVIG